MLSTFFGINGVGKDSLAKQIMTLTDDIIFVRQSQVMMYLLGIVKSFDIADEVSDDHHACLANMDPTLVREIELKEYPVLIQDLSLSNKMYVMLAHLVIATYYSGQCVYLSDEKIPSWYVKSNNWLIDIRANDHDIFKRREAEYSKRKRPLSLEQIREHQSLCNTEWHRLTNSTIQPQRGMRIVINDDINSASSELLEILTSHDS